MLKDFTEAGKHSFHILLPQLTSSLVVLIFGRDSFVANKYNEIDSPTTDSKALIQFKKNMLLKLYYLNIS
ncbi:hypothetical protein Gasu2_22480 [Galdieria sulphuraria]|nr:hypothetical protein Gasu2_22480 [Galdieria sulphuraria]